MSDLRQSLSANFTLREFLRSDTAERNEKLLQEQENPPQSIIDSLDYLVDTALQPIRTGLGHSITINSGYRCLQVNERIGGSPTSQHCKGEAADCLLSANFLNDRGTQTLREDIIAAIEDSTGETIRPDINENFFLFAFICLHLDALDIDQVIHEYGDGFGRPAWVHIAASRGRDSRQVFFIGRYTDRKYIRTNAKDALTYFTKA